MQLEGYRKVLAMLVPLVAAILNSIPVLPKIEMPTSYDLETFIPWVIGVVVMYTPTIIALIGSTYYTKKNVEEAKAFAAVSVAAAPAAPLMASKPVAVTPAMPAVKPTTIYQYADVDGIAKEIEAKYPNDPLKVAYTFYSTMNGFDLRLVQPKDRVKQSKEFIQKAKALFWDSFKKFTGLEPPTDGELANIYTVSYKIKKDYEKANGLVCSGKTFDEINSLLGAMDDFIKYDKAFALIGDESENLDWSTFSGRGYSPLDVPIYAGALVKKG